MVPEPSSELAARALQLAPRIRLEPARGLLWVDVRDLNGRSIALDLLQLGEEYSLDALGAGLANTPIAALIAARNASPPAPAFGSSRSAVAGSDTAVLEDASRLLVAVPPGQDAVFLSRFDIGMLEPPPSHLYPLLSAVGIETIGELARLDRESVESRFGMDGVTLWRLARASDPGPWFAPRPPDPPHAELEWVDYELDRQEQVVFIVNALLGTVCDALAGRGQGAHVLELEFALANGTVARHPARCSNPTADRRVWLRVIRATLEGVTFDAPVTRIAMRVRGAAPVAARQGDLFDAGFATARATEAALAHVLDIQNDAVVTAHRTSHPLLEQRLTWLADSGAGIAGLAQPLGASPSASPRLSLQLLWAPRPVLVELAPRRDGQIPVGYRDGLRTHRVNEALGPDRVSGGFGSVRFDREYFQCVRADGMVVLLYRDVAEDRWFLGGWWD